MSTSDSASPVSDERMRMFKFRRLTLITLTVLAVLATGLGAVNAVQGPHLTGATINAQSAITHPGQRLLLQSNQPLRQVDFRQVRVEPAAPITLVQSNSQLAVQFSSVLDYDTTYTVSVPVTSAATGLSSTLRYAFTTPWPEVVTLVRHSDDSKNEFDQIRVQSLGDAPSQLVYDAWRIQEYAASPSGLLAVTLDGTDAPGLTYTPIAHRDVRQLRLPNNTQYVQSVRASDVSNLFGYLLITSDQSGSYDGNLYLYDPSDSIRDATEVEGPSKSALSVMDWDFVPGSTQLLVQSTDCTLYLVTPNASTPPVALGSFCELLGFLPGSSQLAVSNGGTNSIIDLSTGTATRFTPPTANLDEHSYPGRTLLISTSEVVQSVSQIQLDPFQQRTSLLAIDRSGHRVLVPPSANTIVTNYCASPNGQYVAAEIAPSPAESDHYPLNAGFPGTQTAIIDITNGQTLRTLDGMLPNWCR